MGGARSSMAKPVGKPLARLKIKNRASIAGTKGSHEVKVARMQGRRMHAD